MLNCVTAETPSGSNQRWREIHVWTEGWVGVCAGKLPRELQLSNYQPGVGMWATRWACSGPRQLTSSGKICELQLSARHGPRYWGRSGATGHWLLLLWSCRIHQLRVGWEGAGSHRVIGMIHKLQSKSESDTNHGRESTAQRRTGAVSSWGTWL